MNEFVLVARSPLLRRGGVVREGQQFMTAAFEAKALLESGRAQLLDPEDRGRLDWLTQPVRGRMH